MIGKGAGNTNGKAPTSSASDDDAAKKASQRQRASHSSDVGSKADGQLIDPKTVADFAEQHALRREARAASAEKAAKQAFLDDFHDTVLNTMSEDRMRRVANDLKAIGCWTPESVGGAMLADVEGRLLNIRQVRRRGYPFAPTVLVSGDPQGSGPFGTTGNVGTRDELERGAARLSAVRSRDALTGNTLGSAIFYFTGNAKLAAAVGGVAGSVGGAAKLRNDFQDISNGNTGRQPVYPGQ